MFISISGINWSIPQNVKEAVESWNLKEVDSSIKKTWQMIPACIFLSIWKERNHRCFDGDTSRRGSMELVDRAVGLLLTLTSLSIFTYYTFWVIILPLVDSDHFMHKYFLPQEYAILIPVYAAVALICLLSVFIGYVMLKSKKKKA
ncbi:dolichol-phosphate mannose synthase subunit 2-like isoform X1 [Lycium barbarum]|uniref:dolichol-phosphate mannose synthase subunit 2-like isoform X1 n=2 Tax=Lycium barbarum TaxID=112863 RepID=UPI00293E2638|nr:dolichol-phosphate mannose synthase subunit 2-like isoform X1 [Lycium barbarum]